jgi:hypothetical protein
MNLPYQQTMRIKLLENEIKKHLSINDTYHFRPIKIDGINVYIVLYGKYKILNVESIYIMCNVNMNGNIEKQQYSLFHCHYKTIKGVLNKVEKINKYYRIYNGEIVSPKSYYLLKLEESILPYTEDEKCTVCYENTSDITCCGHSICLNCRELCILKNQKDCPICRSKNALDIYTNKNGLVNNEHYDIVKKAIHYENVNSSSNDFIPLTQDETNDYNSDSEENSSVTEERHISITQNINETDNTSENETDNTSENDVPEIFWRISRSPSSIDEDENNNLQLEYFIPM